MYYRADGLGGVHLVCDATNETAVATLRQRKRRYQKPLALMARDTEVIRQYCYVSDAEAALLQGRHAPIVLLERKIPHPQPFPARGEGSKRQESGGLSCSLTPCGGGLGGGYLLHSIPSASCFPTPPSMPCYSNRGTRR
ncbi:Sua5/YciO/YrdC/YwlC family protein [Thiothrix subterranea]|uniref:Sua5/YciO/YrdC/YwlC family protein n=1 Tax=Thiothrix subterranea TaxID=2735563 RepID=UPI00280C1903|nr:Sua5/YciO/YrdC/YwlC family protein [Thiothrix subterranea]